MLRPEARALALGWIERRDSLSADMVGPVLMTAARFADAPTFEKLQAALVEEQDQRDRHELLTVIAKVRDPGLRERAFANVFLRRNGTMVLNGGHVYDLLDSAMRDDASRAAAFDFMRANFDSALAKMPQDTFAWLLHGFAGLCTARERDVFREFFAARAGRFLGAELAYRQTLEEIELCVASRGGVKPEFASMRPY
jgi:alanyl aminopeptidase